VAGGLAGRAKYLVVVSQVPDGVHLSFVSTMSGWSGSLVGVAREHAQRKEFFDQLQGHLGALRAPATPSPPAAATNDDPIAALERLREMRNRDLISEEEYERKRSEVVDRL
jgi:Short C-terminal domain